MQHLRIFKTHDIMNYRGLKNMLCSFMLIS
jgi:hypothetical protein